MVLLPDWLGLRAQTHADRPALEFGDTVLSFADLDRLARGYEAALAELRVPSNQVVATLLHNRPELVALAHSIPRSGRVFAPVGVRLKSAEVKAMLKSCSASVLIYEQATKDTVAALPASDRQIRLCIDGAPLAGDLALAPAPASRPEVAAQIDLTRTHTIVFTSGSSGRPKAVRLSWGNHYWSAMGSALNLGLRSEDRWLCCLPLNHVGGLSILIRSVLYGNTVELHPRFAPEEVNAAIHRRGATIVSAVANMLQRMLDADGGPPYPPSLRAILVGGGATPRALIDRCQDLGAPILLTYGLTETASQVATTAPGEWKLDAGVGHPLAHAQVRIVDEDGTPAPAETHGHIEVSGPIVSPGYLDGHERQPGEWLHTRDRGWLDRHGRLHVLGRGDETIVCGGENVHPREVERALETHPSVAEAFATGVADERWGAVFHAAVRLNRSVSEEELQRHCRQRLAAFKAPRRIAVVDDFPRTPAGKIARADAARRLSAGTLDTTR